MHHQPWVQAPLPCPVAQACIPHAAHFVPLKLPSCSKVGELYNRCPSVGSASAPAACKRARDRGRVRGGSSSSHLLLAGVGLFGNSRFLGLLCTTP